MVYYALTCRCGHGVFRVSGWPRITTGRGNLFWRSVTRVFRETRQPMENGEPLESPFFLPIFARCDQCGRDARLLDGEVVVGRLGPEGQREPRESFRCRVCRRGRMELAVGEASDAVDPGRADFELVARCHACARESRVAWSEGRPSEQEVRLDLLYGRR